MKVLTTNPKLAKSTKYGFKSFGIHLAPSTLSGKNTCPSASKGCSSACLNGVGYGKMPLIQEARIKKTKLFFSDKTSFMEKLIKEVNAKVNTSKKTGLTPVFRLNLTSDIAWEAIKYQGKNIMEHFPDVQFMDYTKSLPRMMRFLTGQFPKNYHLTFSRSESNDDAVNIVLGCNGSVAVVFKDKLPKTWRGKKVIDGVRHDLRFNDKKNIIVGLLALGKKAKNDESGFVI